MQTVKIALVLGLLGSAVAIGLAYAWAAIAGTGVTRDEIARLALLSFLIATSVTVMLRSRPKR